MCVDVTFVMCMKCGVLCVMCGMCVCAYLCVICEVCTFVYLCMCDVCVFDFQTVKIHCVMYLRAESTNYIRSLHLSYNNLAPTMH